MRKRALKKEFYMEIRKTLNRFLSILLINALGVAFFAGVRASKPDMRLSADAFFDESNLMDIRVMGTLGMTEEDAEAIAAVEGVKEVMPVRSVDMFGQLGDRQLNLQVMSQPEEMNRIHVREGRLPKEKNECLVDYNLLTSGLCVIGEEITLASGTEDETSDLVNQESFTIVGAGTTSYYMSLDRGTTGIGSGSLDGFLIVRPEVFEQDYYTQICVTAEGAYELTCYTEEYDNLVDDLVERIESIEKERCDIRYAEIQEEGQEKIADAEKEVADGEQKLKDAGEELEDARVKLADAEEKLSDGKKELADGEAEFADKEKEFLDGKQEVADGWKELNEAKEELVKATYQIQKGYAEYEKNKAEVDAGYAQLAPFLEQLAQIEDGLAQTENGLAQVQEGIEQAEEGLGQIEAQLLKIERDRQRYQELLSKPEDQRTDAEKEELDALKEKEPGWSSLEKGLEEKQTEIEAQQAGLAAQQTELKARQTELLTAQAQLSPIVQENKAKLDAGAAALAEGKRKLDAGSDEVDAGNSKAYEAEQELLEAEEELADGEKKLADGRSELADARQTLKDAETELADAKAEFADGEAEYEEALEENEETLADARVKIADAKQELADLKQPEWYVLDRQYIQTYVEYGNDADRIGAIGEVFPAIFFLVAALVSLTTMTRMVEEQRTQIGTLKALGYGKGSIASKYILYALLSSLLGSLIGLAAGQKILPAVIISAYKILYNNLPDILTPLNLEYSVTASAVAVSCTTLAAVAACYRELNAVPANLMRPAAPKSGKRVFLEYIGFLWRHLTFSQKAAVRNLVRYKKRFFMTIFGIGGCMALLLVGFGIKDSILYIGNGQFGNVFDYDGSIGIDKDADAQEREELVKQIEGDERILHHMRVLETAVDAEAGGAPRSAYLIVPEFEEELDTYIHLRNRTTREHYALDSQGIVITEKLARLLGVSKGDTIVLKEDDTKAVEVRVAHITEQYFMHYVYMSRELYESLYGEAPEWNQWLIKNDRQDEAFEEELRTEYIRYDAVADVDFISGTAERVADMLKSMDLIIYVLVIAAGLLAFVVLYNLNNININERRRELATLKVLGFFDQEVSAYVNRENVLLTVIGTGVGVGLGILLHRFVVQTAEIDMLMFGRDIAPASYVYSVLLTFVFSAFVNGVMFFKLRKIDMVESLKSVE